MHAPLDDVKTGPSAAMTLLLAAACGIVVANIYYAQPLIGLIGPQVGLSGSAASLIVSVTQLGYATGLILLVPLGDLLENRRLIVTAIAASLPALALTVLAQSGSLILLAAAWMGLTSVAVQMLVPLAAHMAPAHRRGAVVGNVMSGLLLGILLSRPIASILTDLSGSWRTVFAVSFVVTAIMMIVLRFRLPVRQPQSDASYGQLLASLFRLPLTMPVLRQRAAYQAAAFGGFSLFWTGVPLLLASAFHYSQAGIAAFALVGAAGALAAPVAGRVADRGWSGPGTVAAQAMIAAAFIAAAVAALLHAIILLALAGVVLDAGVQTNLVIGQRAIYALAPELRSRLNGIFMAMFFLGGAAGSAVTSPVYAQFGWTGVCVVGAMLPAAALVYFVLARR